MKQILKTDSNNWSALVARLAAGIVLFPHGAQKLLGLFGGYGFQGTMGFLTTTIGLPYVLALLVILIESVGALFLILGLFTRVAAVGVFGLFVGIMAKIHLANGFFMNWGGDQKGEGIEYFLLLFGLTIALVISGGGKWSLDALLSKTKQSSRTPSRRLTTEAAV